MSALILVALAAAPVQLHDTTVLCDQTLVPNAESTVYVSVQHSSSIRRSRPAKDAEVEVWLNQAKIATGRTDQSGQSVLSFMVPQVAVGQHRLRIVTRSNRGTDEVVRQVTVRRNVVLSLRADRTIFRPGETLRYVVALLNHANARPVETDRVAVQINDPTGTQIWRGEIPVAESGWGVGELPLSEDLRLGNYTLLASALGKSAQVSVKVREVELPAFFVTIDQEAEQVVARYPYGEPVSGSITLFADGSRVRAGVLDPFGRYSFTFERGVRYRAEVTDGAKRTEKASLHVPLPSSQIKAAILPERSYLIPNRKQYVTVLTTDGMGELAEATVSLTPKGLKVHGPLTRSSSGALRILVTPTGKASLAAEAIAANGRKTKATRALSTTRAPGWVRPRSAVLESERGVEIFGGFDGLGRTRTPVLISLVKDHTPLASTVVVPDSRGVFRGTLNAPDGVFGLTTVRAAEIKENPRTAVASLYLAPMSLSVALSGKVRHRPGATADITARVTDADGGPAAGVGLFAAVVDERSLALSRKQRDLVELLTEMDVEKARVLGLVFSELLTSEARPQLLARRAIVETLPASAPRPFVQRDAQIRETAEARRIPSLRNVLVRALADAKLPLGEYQAGKGWSNVRSLHQILSDGGWRGKQLRTPWNRYVSWSYVRHFDRSGFNISRLAREAQQMRMERLTLALRGLGPGRGGLDGLVGAGSIAPSMRRDMWGHGMSLKGGTLRSAGPDARFGTGDDLVQRDVYASHGVGGLGSRGVGAGGGGSAMGIGRLGSRRVRTARVRAAPAAIRAKFDETVLWAAGWITDERGEAKIRVPFSDSVTGWRLSVDALGKNGAVGKQQMRLQTFLPLSIDAAVPRVLTQGDRYTLSVVAANHSARTERLEVRVATEGSLDGARNSTMELIAGTTRAVPVPVFAARPGPGTVTLTLLADDRPVDVVKRKVKVEPPGRMRHVLLTSVISSADSQTLNFEMPEPPAPESFEGEIRLYRNPADQALDGIEGLLREPHGCFEQTSSASYPNLMVLNLLEKGPETAEIRKKAYDMIGRGYQRLISYEVPGGGFSWFGKAPAHRALTAYGLLQFADMQKVYPVDPSLIHRTTTWLTDQQQTDGSWPGDDRHLHDWSAVQGRLSSTAFVVWALAESGYRGAPLQRGLAYLRAHASDLEKKPYLLSLWASAESLLDAKQGQRIVLKLRKFSSEPDEGLTFTAGEKTLFYAKGKNADVQVTALATSALHRTGDLLDAQSTLRWLWSARSPRYSWGSPQGTVLALRAAGLAKTAPADHDTIGVALDGRHLGHRTLEGAEQPMMTLPELRAGAHRLRIDQGAGLLADVRMSWRSQQAPAAVQAGLEVSLDVPKEPIAFGRRGKLGLTVSNPGKAAVVMPTAIVPVAPGFVADRKSLERLKIRGAIERYETTGSAVHLYFTKLASKQTIELDVEVTAEAECDVTQRAARVYAYYSPETMGESATYRIKGRMLDSAR